MVYGRDFPIQASHASDPDAIDGSDKGERFGWWTGSDSEDIARTFPVHIASNLRDSKDLPDEGNHVNHRRLT